MMWEDYGESSLTLLAVHCGMDKLTPTTPRDKGDFKRCLHLFDCLGLSGEEVNELVEKTANKYSIWKPFFNNWTKLLNLYFGLEPNKFYEFIYELNNFTKGKKDD